MTGAVFEPLSAGKKANRMMNDQVKHSFTYTPDAGKATALLGVTSSAYCETGIYPLQKPLTGKEWVENIANEVGVKPNYRLVGKTIMKFIGLFNSTMKESCEMLYQYDKDYVFNSEKFEKKFSFSPTTCLDGIRPIIECDYKK